MSTASPTICPKCNYARTAADSAPAWQCPSCRVAYNKFGDAPGPQAGEGVAAPRPAADLRVRRLPAGGAGGTAGRTALTVYGVVLFGSFFLLLLIEHILKYDVLMIWLPALIAACAFYFCLSAYRRLRTFADVTTSTVAAAARGYVGLQGTAVAAPGNSLSTHLTRMPCVWYRYDYVKNRGNEQAEAWETGERSVPFILRDATGDCLIDPEKAEVICGRSQGHEWSILVGDPVYAIGNLSSGGAAAERHLNLKAGYALVAQERDKEAHAARYDANQDGTVDRQETALAREALKREVMEEYAGQGGVRTLGPSPDGRPFLVSSASPESIASYFQLLAVAHLGVFFIALGVAAYNMKM